MTDTDTPESTPTDAAAAEPDKQKHIVLVSAMSDGNYLSPSKVLEYFGGYFDPESYRLEVAAPTMKRSLDEAIGFNPNTGEFSGEKPDAVLFLDGNIVPPVDKEQTSNIRSLAELTPGVSSQTIFEQAPEEYVAPFVEALVDQGIGVVMNRRLLSEVIAATKKFNESFEENRAPFIHTMLEQKSIDPKSILIQDSCVLCDPVSQMEHLEPLAEVAIALAQGVHKSRLLGRMGAPQHSSGMGGPEA